MAALLLVISVVGTLALLTWVVVTLPADAAAATLWRRGDAAASRGDDTAAERCRRVADGLEGNAGLYRSSAVLAMGRLRRAHPDAPIDDTTRDIAVVWARSSLTLLTWAAFVTVAVAARHPRLIAHPDQWRQQAIGRVAALFAAHDAAVEAHGTALADAHAELAAVRGELDRWTAGPGTTP